MLVGDVGYCGDREIDVIQPMLRESMGGCFQNGELDIRVHHLAQQPLNLKRFWRGLSGFMLDNPISDFHRNRPDEAGPGSS